jgi:hypothetical protein
MCSPGDNVHHPIARRDQEQFDFQVVFLAPLFLRRDYDVTLCRLRLGDAGAAAAGKRSHKKKYY